MRKVGKFAIGWKLPRGYARKCCLFVLWGLSVVVIETSNKKISTLCSFEPVSVLFLPCIATLAFVDNQILNVQLFCGSPINLRQDDVIIT